MPSHTHCMMCARAGRKPKRLKKARAAALAVDGSELEASLGGAPAARRPAPAVRKNNSFVRPSSALSDRQCALTAYSTATRRCCRIK